MWLLQTICFSLGCASLSAMTILSKKKEGTEELQVDEDVKKMILIAMITSMIIIILIVVLSGFLFTGGTFKKIGSTFVFLLITATMFIVVANVMGVGLTGKNSTVMTLVGVIFFFILDTNLIMRGAYTFKAKPKELTYEDAIYASMRLFSDFILIFSLILQCLAK